MSFTVCRHSTPLGRTYALERLIHALPNLARKEARLRERGRHDEAEVLYSMSILVECRARLFAGHAIDLPLHFTPRARMGQNGGFDQDLRRARGWRKRFPNLGI